MVEIGCVVECLCQLVLSPIEAVGRYMESCNRLPRQTLDICLGSFVIERPVVFTDSIKTFRYTIKFRLDSGEVVPVASIAIIKAAGLTIGRIMVGHADCLHSVTDTLALTNV